MKKLLTIVLAVTLVALFGGTLWYLWRKAQKPVVVYKTETASVSDIIKKTVATGSVIPRKEVAVKPQVSGIIESIKVENEGWQLDESVVEPKEPSVATG